MPLPAQLPAARRKGSVHNVVSIISSDYSLVVIICINCQDTVRKGCARLTGWKIDVKAKSAVPSLNLEENTEVNNYDSLFDDDAFGDIN